MVVSNILLSRIIATLVIPPSEPRNLYIVGHADSCLLSIAIHLAITVAIAIASAICPPSGLIIDKIVSSEIWLEYSDDAAFASMSCPDLDFDDFICW